VAIPTIRVPHMPRHSRTDPAYLKAFGSRPEGRSDQDRKRKRAWKYIERLARTAA
jgi:hypothetical protein